MKIRSVLTVMTLALCGAPLALSLGAAPAGAAPTPLSGTCTGGIALAVPSVRLVSPGYANGVSTFERSERVGTPFVLAPGTYGVTAGSTDRAHPDVTTQDHEQWYAVFFTASNAEAGRTEAVPDLADTATSAAWTLADLVLTAPAASVQYVHAGVSGATTADSVEPACLVLTAPPVSTTTTTVAATTTTLAATTTTVAATTTTVGVTSTTLGATPPAFPVTTSTVPTAPIPPAPAPTVAGATVAGAPVPPTTMPPTTVAAVVSVPVTAGPEVLGTAVERPLAITGGSDTLLGMAAALMILAGLVLVSTGTRVRNRSTRR